MKLTRQQTAAMIDHTLLKPNATRKELGQLCDESIDHGFKAVCVNPIHVEEAVQRLRGSGVLICSVIGFPLGTHTPTVKAYETEEAVQRGAREIDMVIRVGALKEGRDHEALEDIRAVVRAAQGCPVKVILETCLLTNEEKRRGCRLALEAGASFVKTSTGFAASGATVSDVKLMRETVGKEFGIKAAGGIRTHKDAFNMIEAGATRLGMSASVALMREMSDL